MEREAEMEEALTRIKQWADAYPNDIFTPVDAGYLQRANDVLKQHGMCVDRLSADAMRYALTGVGKIATAALTNPTTLNAGELS